MRISWKYFAAAVLLVSLGVLPLTGCARKTVQETTTVAPGTTAVAPVSSTNTTTVVEKETVHEEHSSVLGTVFDVIGEVIALPFRIVAGVFRFIF